VDNPRETGFTHYTTDKPIDAFSGKLHVPGVKKRRKRRRRAPQFGFSIREMELDDLPEVFALGQRLFRAEKLPTLYRSWDEYEIVELFASEGDFCFVAETEHRIVGFALGCLMEKYRSPWRYGWLLWLGVSPRFRGGGIAARLLNHLSDRFTEHGARIMLVDTDAENKAALHFFRKQGFGSDLMHVYLSKNFEEHKRRVRRKHVKSLRRRRVLGSRLARGRKRGR
jgi:ribosomal protein S18 acetylase RimI-like enzyme